MLEKWRKRFSPKITRGLFAVQDGNEKTTSASCSRSCGGGIAVVDRRPSPCPVPVNGSVFTTGWLKMPHIKRRTRNCKTRKISYENNPACNFFSKQREQPPETSAASELHSRRLQFHVLHFYSLSLGPSFLYPSFLYPSFSASLHTYVSGSVSRWVTLIDWTVNYTTGEGHLLCDANSLESWRGCNTTFSFCLSAAAFNARLIYMRMTSRDDAFAVN